MPLDIRSQVVTALDNINRNPALYTPTKPTIPLETRINDLKEANPSKYRDYISTLTSSANRGNEEARELLGKGFEKATYLNMQQKYPNLQIRSYLQNAGEQGISEAAKRVWKSLVQDGAAYSIGDNYLFKPNLWKKQ